MKSRAGRSERIRDRGVAANHGDARTMLQASGDVVVVSRGRVRSIVINCPCGCGDIQALNLDWRVGEAWHFYRGRKGISVFPSVWRESGCRSHFIIWDDRIYWCDYEYDDFEGVEGPKGLDRAVLQATKNRKGRHFSAIAKTLNETPWAVLATCRRLCKAGQLEEEGGTRMGYFRQLRNRKGSQSGGE